MGEMQLQPWEMRQVGAKEGPGGAGGRRAWPAGPGGERPTREQPPSASCWSHDPVPRERAMQESGFRWMNIQCVITAPDSLSWFPSKTLIPLPTCLTFMECWRSASFGSHRRLLCPPDDSAAVLALTSGTAAQWPFLGLGQLSAFSEAWSPPPPPPRSFQDKCQHSRADTCPLGSEPEPKTHLTQAT